MTADPKLATPTPGVVRPHDRSGFADAWRVPFRTVERTWIGGIFFSALFLPTFYNLLGTAGAILVNGGVLAAAALYVLVIRRGVLPLLSTAERQVVLLLLGVMLYYAVAIGFSTLFLSERIVVRDLYEIHRPILYSFVLVLPFCFLHGDADIAAVKRWLHIAFVLLLLIGFNQFLRGWDGLSELYTKSLNIASRRIAAPFPNPYDYAFVMLFLFLYYFFQLIWQRRLVLAVPTFLSAVALVLTQSRSVIGAFGITLGVIVPAVLLYDARTEISRLRVPARLLVLGGFLGMLALSAVYAVVAYQDSLGYVVSGFERVLRGEELRPLTIRQEQFAIAIEQARGSVPAALFGNGPSKSTMQYVESIYTYFLFRYGVLGLLIVFVFPLVLTLVLLFRLLRQGTPHKELVLAILCWLLALPVASIGSNFTEQIRISFLYYFLVSSTVRLYSLRQST